MNINPTDMANAVTTIITCKAEPWKIVLGLFAFAYWIGKTSRVEFSGEICGRDVAYSSEPGCPVERFPDALPPEPEQGH